MQIQMKMLACGNHNNFTKNLQVPHVEVNGKTLGIIEALENGTIAGAGLETRQRLVSILADNIKKFMEGNPINAVSSL